MKFLLVIACGFFFFPHFASGQDTSLYSAEPDNISIANFNAGEVSIDLTSPEELERALKRLHTFKHLRSVVLEGKVNRDTLEKVLYRLSMLKNLTDVTLKNNELKRVPDNIAVLKSLRSVTIQGNKELDYDDLYLRLSETQITCLNLAGNDIKKIPPSISKIRSLKRVGITGNDQLNYEDLVDQLAKLPALTELSIPVNFITDLPRNITKLPSLQVLDVSNNVLTDLPDEVSALKAINNLSIQGNLILNPVKDLGKFQGNQILYLALDKEISGEEIEKIKQMFPKAEINFPIDEEEDRNDRMEDSIRAIGDMPGLQKNAYKGELKAKKISSILSTAYLGYPALFRSVVYNFDTLNFDERHLNFRYTNVYQRVRNRGWDAGNFYFRKSLYTTEKRGKISETWFRFARDNHVISTNYPELRAFYGMYWIYQGPLTKGQFKRKFLRKRRGLVFSKTIRWHDVRIEFDKNNSMFSIYVKGDSAFEKFTAYPVVSNMAVESCQQTYNRRYILYQKTLLKRAQSFKRNQMIGRRNYDNNFSRMQDYAWKELQLRMSDQEKVMSKDEWLAYYDNIVANEQGAISNSPLAIPFISRGLVLKGYNERLQNNRPAPGAVPAEGRSKKFGYKDYNVDFIDEKSGGKLAVINIIVIDGQERSFTQVAGTLGILPNIITMREYSPYTLLVELRNGNFGLVSPAEISKKMANSNKDLQVHVRIFDRNLDTIGGLFKDSGL